MSDEFYSSFRNNTEFVCINQGLNILQVTEQCTLYINNEADPLYNITLCGKLYFVLRTKLSVPQDDAHASTSTVTITESKLLPTFPSAVSPVSISLTPSKGTIIVT